MSHLSKRHCAYIYTIFIDVQVVLNTCRCASVCIQPCVCIMLFRNMCTLQCRASPRPSSRDKAESGVVIATEQEYDFVERPSEDFFCPVTKDLLLQPHLTACCGHHLSDEAATRIQREGGACPMCKEKKLTTLPDKYFSRQVHELRVFCRHKERGCGWEGELSAWEHHVQSCPRKNSPIVTIPLCECSS